MFAWEEDRISDHPSLIPLSTGNAVSRNLDTVGWSDIQGCVGEIFGAVLTFACAGGYSGL